MSGVQIYKPSESSRKLLREYKRFTGIPEMVTDEPSWQPNFEGFQAHRHDQSILSILTRKHNCEIARDPTQFGKDDKIGFHGQVYPVCMYNHGVAGESVPVNQPQVTVITPSIVHSKLERAIQSVQEQSYQNVEHIIVLDKPEKEQELKDLISEYENKKRTIKYSILAYNTGADNWNGHRVYAAYPHLLHKADWIVYLDEDNWFESSHIESMVNLVVNNKLHWGFSLRRIVDQDGKFVCNDNCESLGSLHSVYNNPYDYLVDTSCYIIQRNLAQQLSMIWNKPTRPKPPLMEPDRELCKVLVSQAKQHGCTLKYTVNYSTSNRSDSVSSYYFMYGNHMMAKKYPDGLPWQNKTQFLYQVNDSKNHFNPEGSRVNDQPTQKQEIQNGNENINSGKPVGKPVLYVCHFTKEATERYFQLQNQKLEKSVAYEEWQMTLLNHLKKHFVLKNGYTETVPAGATVLVNICLPQCLPMDLLNRKDITRVGYTLEGPNIRHQQQWQRKTLETLFDKVLTYWAPLLDNPNLNPNTQEPTKFYWCPFIHRIDPESQLDKSWIKENKHFDTSVVMILEQRKLSGRYKIDNSLLECLDPLRGECAKYMQKQLTVYGQGWEVFKKENGLTELKIGHTLGKFKDPKPNVEIIKDFTFNLIIENCDAEDYVSEKFCDALVAGAIPIYWGNIGKRMKEIIPNDIYIDAKAFKTPERLSKVIKTIGVKEINRYKDAINRKRNAVLEKLSPAVYADCVVNALMTKS